MSHKNKQEHHEEQEEREFHRRVLELLHEIVRLLKSSKETAKSAKLTITPTEKEN